MWRRLRSPSRWILDSPRNERGAALIFVVFALLGLLAICAFAIDLGLLYVARTESQRSADGAALAGAGHLAVVPGDEDGARETAKEYAARNWVRGAQPSVQDADVDVILGGLIDTVRVRVHNTAARGNAIPTLFARILGIETRDVRTVAAAEVTTVGAGAASCPLPIALPNQWIDDGDGVFDPPDDVYDPETTGYTEADWGERIEVKTQPAGATGGPAACQGGDAFDACNALGEDSSWRCWFVRPDETSGNNILAPRIFPGDCDGANGVFGTGDEIETAGSSPGNRQSLVNDEFVQVVESDPTAFWDETGGADGRGCVARPEEGCVEGSTRMRSVPLSDPTTASGSGTNLTTDIIGWMGVFVEKVSCHPERSHGFGPPGQWNVYVRLTGITGVGGGPDGTTGQLFRRVRLVE